MTILAAATGLLAQLERFLVFLVRGWCITGYPGDFTAGIMCLGQTRLIIQRPENGLRFLASLHRLNIIANDEHIKNSCACFTDRLPKSGYLHGNAGQQR
ncbi:MAG: hypothetical protein P8X52_02955 [Limibacillus sp.]